MIETQVAQLASSCLNHDMGKLPRQPEVNPKENVNAVTTQARQSAQKPPFPQDAGTRRKTITARNTDAENEVPEEAKESNPIAIQEDIEEAPRASREYHNTTGLPFLEKRRRPVAGEQFGKFVEVIKKIYGNTPLFDTV